MKTLTTTELEEILESAKKPGIKFFDVIEFGHMVAHATIAKNQKSSEIASNSENNRLNDVYAKEFL